LSENVFFLVEGATFCLLDLEFFGSTKKRVPKPKMFRSRSKKALIVLHSELKTGATRARPA